MHASMHASTDLPAPFHQPSQFVRKVALSTHFRCPLAAMSHTCLVVLTSRMPAPVTQLSQLHAAGSWHGGACEHLNVLPGSFLPVGHTSFLPVDHTRPMTASNGSASTLDTSH